MSTPTEVTLTPRRHLREAAHADVKGAIAMTAGQAAARGFEQNAVAAMWPSLNLVSDRVHLAIR